MSWTCVLKPLTTQDIGDTMSLPRRSTSSLEEHTLGYDKSSNLMASKIDEALAVYRDGHGGEWW